MKRYAVLRSEESVLTFNEITKWFDKTRHKWVAQHPRQEVTVERFERKYGKKLIWQEKHIKENGRDFSVEGFAIARGERKTR